MDPRKTEPSDLEKELQQRFNPDNLNRFNSRAQEVTESELVKALVLPPESRGRLPYSREDFVIEENPARVEWERQVRIFLSRLNTTDHGHRVTAPDIYEWTTGIKIADLAEAEGVADKDARGGGNAGSANMHLRHINAILREYFGQPYKTTILGRPVGKAYKVRKSFRVKLKKPACLTLLPDWENGTLDKY